MGPLNGVRILDLTSVVMGPLATQIMGDLGADVVVIETGNGDINRAMGFGPHPELSGVALNLMRNKRSVSLDLKTAAGRAAFLRLVADADVVITNLRPGPLGRLGLTYGDLVAVRPQLIMCRAHGYPSDSDQANAPAYDDIIQSASAIGDLYKRAGSEPSLLPTLVADKVSGMSIAYAVMAALFHRERTGEGQDIEVPMIDVMRSFVLVEHGASAIPEPALGAPGHVRILTPERKPQQTTNGWINVLPYRREDFLAVFRAGGLDDMDDDPRFATRAARLQNSDSLYRDIAKVLATNTTEHWLAFCEANGIPATEAASLDDLVDELPIATHPLVGKYRETKSPVRFSATPVEMRLPAPLVGQHGREVLAAAGFTNQEMDDLEAAGTLGTPSR
jgi:crotonobetainyl-CoA:carnitine CoA-transferase CaiB-like acyl-CoA transferase